MLRESRCAGVEWEVMLPDHAKLAESDPPSDGEGTGSSEKGGDMA